MDRELRSNLSLELVGGILFAPAGDLVPVALRALDRGGTLAMAGIWSTNIPALNYDETLFQERRLLIVTPTPGRTVRPSCGSRPG